MPIVGSLVQVDPLANQEVQISLSALPDVTVHAFDTPGKMAMIVERAEMKRIHDLLEDVVQNVAGVLAIYPVYTYLGDDLDQMEEIDVDAEIAATVSEIIKQAV